MIRREAWSEFQSVQKLTRKRVGRFWGVEWGLPVGEYGPTSGRGSRLRVVVVEHVAAVAGGNTRPADLTPPSSGSRPARWCHFAPSPVKLHWTCFLNYPW